MSQQIIYGASSQTFAPNVTAASTFPFGAGGFSASNHFQRALLPAANGIIKAFRGTQTAAPGGARSVTHKIADNTLPGVGSNDCHFTIGSAETSGESGDTLHRVTKGVPVFYSIHGNFGTSATTFVHWSFVFVPDTPGETLLAGSGGTGALSVTNTQYLSFAGIETQFSTSLPDEDCVCPTAGTLKAMFVDTDYVLEAGETRTFTLYKNNIATGLVIALGEGDRRGSELLTDVALGVGNTWVLQCVPTGNPSGATCKIGLVFVADDNDRFLCLTSSDTLMPNNRTRYSFMHDGDIQWNGTQTLRDCLASVGTARAKIVRMRVKLSGTPGFGKSYVFTLVEGGTPSALAATVSGGSSTGAGAVDIPIADDDLFSTQMRPFDLPTPRTAKIAYACESIPATVHLRGGLIQGGAIAVIP